MEALALLCTLHADGPATLQRLRRGGCADLAAVEALPAEELARLVGVSASAARRLAREAGLLRVRLAPGDADALLDREEAPEAIEQAQRPNAALDDNDRALIQRVLTRPRPATPDQPVATPREAEAQREEEVPATAREQRAGSTSPSPTPVEEQSPVAERAFEAEDTDSSVVPEPAAASATSEEEAVAAQGTPLADGTVDGLSSTELATLAAAEVSTLEELAAADVGTLARATGLPFSSIARWVFLARRGGRLPEPPAPDAPFGTGIEEAAEVVPPSVPAAEAQGGDADAPAAEQAPAPEESEAARIDDAVQLTSDGFGACIFEEAAPAPAHAAASSQPLVTGPVDSEPAQAEATQAEATPQPAPDAPVEADPADAVIWGAEPAAASPEPPALEAFEAPTPITEDPTVRPPFWQVRAAWRGEQAARESQGRTTQAPAAPAPAAQAAASAPSAGARAAVVEAPAEERAEAAPRSEDGPAGSTAEAPTPETPPGQRSAEPDAAGAPAAAAREDTHLGWDFVIPSRREAPAEGQGPDPAADRPAEGIGGPFA